MVMTKQDMKLFCFVRPIIYKMKHFKVIQSMIVLDFDSSGTALC